ncbi:uricase [Paenibacillus darwinianus]|uniref:Uricase n=1 Tax=Paenibacillus darwinianus TaxID=1380763 RepID=A0A9W5W6W8_9BACL|nr:urate oxidase [Paenibacillus darwinianus]EXX86905.1 uricase [Paenibacillus darwinianus]EXX87204.1 uricase [Paenibacillus darwinianus]EXX88607.1 uricase [Paenibacillus darwinianus]
MLKLNSGRMLYYGKGDVNVYRTYAKPLRAAVIPESSYTGDGNVIFAHNVHFSVSGESLLSSFLAGDNSQVIATDSMKNFILREAASFEGDTTEGFLAYIGDRFMAKYPHIDAVVIRGDRIPFQPLQVAGAEGLEESGLVYRRSHNDRAGAMLELVRGGEEAGAGAGFVSHKCVLSDLQLIKVSGSSFYGFVRDEYTTLPDSYDRPLFIFLNLFWRYADVREALDGSSGRYVPAEQIRDIAHNVFHENKSPSIQFLIYRIGLRVMERFPQLAEIGFESNNRTWETVVEPADGESPGVFTEPRPPYGFQGFTMTRADLPAVAEELKAEASA